ncbi:hypothetical protein [Rufibacter psychrotolerans]|uniref:hypothetical protein n=1 Tax=Rufibacter psychrotolerans TaxID=2812556 RepID=UPI00196708C8|nr:hypothetical protein [Rufibacter sp. SYSU D00308]
MAKKKKKHQSFYRAVKPFIKDDRIVYALLGAVGAGVALASAIGPDRANSLLERVTSALWAFGHNTPIRQKEEKAEKPKKEGKQPKEVKQPKLVAADQA